MQIVLLTARNLHGTVDFADKTLEHLARAEFDELSSAVGNHVLHCLCPAHGSCELSHEVGLDFSRVGVGLGINILINRAAGSVTLWYVR